MRSFLSVKGCLGAGAQACRCSVVITGKKTTTLSLPFPLPVPSFPLRSSSEYRSHPPRVHPLKVSPYSSYLIPFHL